jgi:carboxypeptidase Taq
VALGFSLDHGRLDVSVHPFTGGSHPTDVRMTTRFKREDLTEGITGAIHETGHALYEQGRNMDHDGQPVNQASCAGRWGRRRNVAAAVARGRRLACWR